MITSFVPSEIYAKKGTRANEPGEATWNEHFRGVSLWMRLWHSTVMDPVIVRSRLAEQEFLAFVQRGFGDLAKVVVDTHRRVIALGGSLHADGEALLLDDGSRQDDLWGANVYPDQPLDRQIEYSSLINIRPRAGNRSMTIEDAAIRTTVAEILRGLLPLTP